MKKRKHIWILIAIAVLVLGAVVSYFLPKRFGRNVTPSQVDRISVFDGSTGTSFLITAPEDIEYIVTNIQSIPMKRAGFSTNRTGFTFKIRYLDHSGKEMIPAFSSSTVTVPFAKTLFPLSVCSAAGCVLITYRNAKNGIEPT